MMSKETNIFYKMNGQHYFLHINGEKRIKKQHQEKLYIWLTNGDIKVMSVKTGKLATNGKSEVKMGVFYLSGLSLAAVLGALCSLGHVACVGSGFSTKNGGPGVSVSHLNGINGDFRYFAKNDAHLGGGGIHTTANNFDWDANVRFVEALYKFGYKHFLSSPVKVNGNKLLPHSSSHKDHYHHLHIQGFKPKVIDI